MRVELPPIPDPERTPLVEALLAVIDAQRQRIHELEEAVGLLKDEIALLKGQSPRPKIAPSRLEAPSPKPPPAPGDKRPGSAKRSKTAASLTPVEVIIPFPDPPPGSTSHGHEGYLVQELHLEARATRYLRERILTPDGRSLLAPLPDGVLPGCHFGPSLHAYVLYQHHQCNVTQPLLLEQLREIGIDISAGQVDRILTHGRDGFHLEKAEVLSAGLGVSSYIGVDDTGARHGGKNGFCTAIGNDLFACFESTDSKSRLNFLSVLRGSGAGYSIDEAALAYYRRQKLPLALIEALAAGPRGFKDEAAWRARLRELGVTAERHVLISTEGALLGQVLEQGAGAGLVVLSDGAAQFDVLAHASCWVHAERPLARMIPYNEKHRAAIEQARDQIWELYKRLKAYRAGPSAEARAALEARFDALVNQPVCFPSIGKVLGEMRDHKADLLRVLSRPEVPLHNNGSESDIRGYVKTRKISGGTRGEAGRRCRDTFASLKKTCRKLGVSFWAYLRDRVRGLGGVARLALLIREKAEGLMAGQAASPEAVGGGAAG